MATDTEEGPIKRLNYFKHQFLRVDDFVDEQKYHINMRRRHNRYMHTWGVAGEGLRVSASQGATEVKVSKGMAVDSMGREIVLIDEKVLPLSGFDANVPVYIVISYADKTSDPSNETGSSGDTRVVEEPNLRPVTDKPSADAGTNILLAKVNRNGEKVVTTIDETDRRAAGVEAGELTVRRLTLRPASETLDISVWPRLSCSGANQAALENTSLKLDTGRELVFDATGQASGQAVGQIRSSDNAHRLVFNRANNRMEFYDSGDIVLLTGGANPAERLRVGTNGNVGIGTSTPGAKLEINNGDLLFKAAAEDPGDIIFQNSAGVQKARIFSPAAAGAGLNLSSADNIPRLTIGATGNVGIGTTDPKYPLSFANVVGDKIALWGSADAHYGFGIQGGLLQIHTDGAGSDVAFGFGSSGAFTETTRIKGNGRVGIGTNAPDRAMTIQSADAGVYLNLKASGGAVEFLLGAETGGTGGGSGVLSTMSDHDLSLRAGKNNPKVTIKASGNVGIGTTDPKFLLSFPNAIGDKIALWGSSDNHYGFGIQGALLQIHTDGAGSDVAFGFGSSANFKETARIRGNGNVGIGTSTPGAKLEINSGDLLFKAAAEDPGDIIFQNSAGVQKARIFSNPSAGAGLNFAVGDNTARLAISAGGDVVIDGGSKVISPMWRAFQILTSSPGPLPKKDIKFTTNGGLVILFVSGSGFTATASQISMSIKVDDTERGRARGFSNEPFSHKSFVPVQLVLALAAGDHKVTLDALTGTSTDGNDFYNVTAVEMPINPEFTPLIFGFQNIGVATTNIGVVSPGIGG